MKIGWYVSKYDGFNSKFTYVETSKLANQIARNNGKPVDTEINS